MAKDYRKQLTFQAGEVSPLFYGRSDAPYYGRGLAEGTNVTVDKRGGIFRRKGIPFTYERVGDKSKVFTKQINVDRFHSFFFSDLQLHMYTPGAGIENWSTLWTEDQIADIHIVEEPGGEKIYFLHPEVLPQMLIYDIALDDYGTMLDVPFVDPPAEWTGTNYPATGAYFQGRLWLGGTPLQPQTFWASVSGSPETFTVTASLDSSSLEFTLQKFGRIKWMLGTKELIIGTENGEHIVSADGPVITPTDVQIQQQSSYGSNNIQGIQVGEKVFYVTPDGRRVQSMAYEWQQDNWLSQDLTFVSEHITEGVAVEQAWAQNPKALFMLALADGDVAVLTYDRTADTVGWCRHTFEGFKVLGVASGTLNGVSKTVMVGQRTSGMLELVVEMADVEDVYMDSYKGNNYPGGDGRDVTGLDHLEGETVQIVADGSVEPPQVVTGGTVTITRDATQIYAGVGIYSKIKTLPPDVDDGSLRSWKKRWNKVWTLLYKSNAPIINGVRPPDRTPSTPMDTPEPTTTGHFKTVNLGWDDFGQITIEENLPVPMNVLAIYGEMGRESL